MEPIYAVGAAILRGTTCLVAQRGPGRAFSGLWEFPGGKVEPGETPEAALAREILEELGLVIDVGPWLGRGHASDGPRPIVLDVFAATVREGTPVLREHSAVCWCAPEELAQLAWADADVPAVGPVQAYLARQG